MTKMTNEIWSMPIDIADSRTLRIRAVDELDAMLTMGRKNLDSLSAIRQLAIDSIYRCADEQVEAWNVLCRKAFDVMSRPAWPTVAPPSGSRPAEIIGMIEGAVAQLRRLSEIIARANTGTLELIHNRTEGCLREIEAAAGRAVAAATTTPRAESAARR